ncbi:hypothetical protein ACSBR1_019581 [Camellia fascicularis]
MIIDRFLSRDAPLNSGAHQLVEAHKSACVRDLNLQLTHVQALLDVEKQRGTALGQLRMAVGQGEHHWSEGSIEEMNLPQLHQFKAAMIELRTKIGIRTDRIVHEQPAIRFGCGVGQTSFGGGAGGAGFHTGLSSFGGVGFVTRPSSFGGGGGNTAAAGGGFFAGLVVLVADLSFAGGGGIGALPFGAGPGSFRAGGGGSDNNGIIPFDGRVSDAGGSKAPYGFNHGYGRGFY